MTTPSPSDVPKTIAALRRLVAADANALAYLTFLAARPKSMRHGRATAEYIQRQFETHIGGPIGRSEAVALIQRLAATGAGHYVVGRSGHKTRIEWSYSTTTLGKAAVKGVDTLTPLHMSTTNGPRFVEDVEPSSARGRLSIPAPGGPLPTVPADDDAESISAVIHARNGARIEVSGRPRQVIPVLREFSQDDGPQPPYLRLSA